MRTNLTTIIEALRAPIPSEENQHVLSILRAFIVEVDKLQPSSLAVFGSIFSKTYADANTAFNNLKLAIHALAPPLRELFYHDGHFSSTYALMSLFSQARILKGVIFKKEFNALLGFNKDLDLEKRFKEILDIIDKKLLQSLNFDDIVAGPKDLDYLTRYINGNKELFADLKIKLDGYIAREESIKASLDDLWTETEKADLGFLTTYCLKLEVDTLRPLKLQLQNKKTLLDETKANIKSILLSHEGYSSTKASLEVLTSKSKNLTTRIAKGTHIERYGPGSGESYLNEDAANAEIELQALRSCQNELQRGLLTLEDEILCKPINAELKLKLKAQEAAVAAQQQEVASLQASLNEAERLHRDISKKESLALARSTLAKIKNLHDSTNALRAKHGIATIELPSLLALCDEVSLKDPSSTGGENADKTATAPPIPSAPPAPVAGVAGSEYADKTASALPIPSAPPAPTVLAQVDSRPAAGGAGREEDPMPAPLAPALLAPTLPAAAEGADRGAYSPLLFPPAVTQGFDPASLPLPPTHAVAATAAAPAIEREQDRVLAPA